MFSKISFARSIACVALLAVAGTTAADEMYYGGSLAFIDYSEPGFDDASVTALYGKVGTSWNENFSGELRVGFGVGDDTLEGIDFEVNHFYGAYVRAGMQVGETFYPYAILGYTWGEIEASTMGISLSASDSDVSFGLGADFDMSESLTLNFEYMNFIDISGVKLDGFSLGFTSTF